MSNSILGGFRLRTAICVAVYVAILAEPVYAAGNSFFDDLSVAEDVHNDVAAHVRHTIQNAVAKVSGAPRVAQQDQQKLPLELDTEWIQFASGELELWLPAGFIGGNLDEDLEIILEALRAQGPVYDATADMLAENPSLFRLFAFNPEQIESGILTNVNIMHERVFSSMSTDAYVDVVAANLPPAFEIREREQTSHPRFDDASRAITHVSMAGAAPMMQVMYFLQGDDNTIWTLTYTAGESIFDELFPLFERSAESFSVTTN